MMDTKGRSAPELLLPAGGFESALAAIEGGADALYFGFAELSARKQARNFDRLEYRRLLAHARSKGVRLYAALNTVIPELELPRAAEILAFLGRFPPDAIIVQDWGLASLIRSFLPSMPIHASTQTAVQGARAVGLAAELGAVRVVLPRETSIAELARLTEANPSMEHEVFVHGALCYSFSGLCLASGLLLGRSGNRGDCAQVCRSYYDAEGGGIDGRRGYWFSCKDLRLVDRIGELARAGASSLKVEGRMKSPEYCYHVARLYRGALDRLRGGSVDDAELARRAEEARVAFSRSPTEAFARSRGGQDLLDPAYPGHRGIEAGRIELSPSGKARVRLETALGLRDGLMVFAADGTPCQFSLQEMHDARSGRELSVARAGSTVDLGLPAMASAGDRLWKISSREMDRKTPSPEEYGDEREAISLSLAAEPGPEIGTLRLSAAIQAPGWEAPIALPPGPPVRAEKAAVPGGFAKALRIFGESGRRDFTLVPRTEIPGGSSPAHLPILDLFVPPSDLKREKNRIYAQAEIIVEDAEKRRAREIAAFPAAFAQGTGMGAFPERIPPRSVLAFPHAALARGMPFATPRDLRTKVALPSWEGASWLPLSPLVADPADYERLVTDRVAAELETGGRILLGLGALHHIALARDLASRFARAGDRLGFFIDIHLYVANRFALATLAAAMPRISFAYFYIEGGAADLAALVDAVDALASASSPVGVRGIPPRLASVDAAFAAPLFLSLGCLRKHHAEGGTCPRACSKTWMARLRDRDRRYVALVDDCVSMLFREDR